jgi:hypothetical protein
MDGMGGIDIGGAGNAGIGGIMLFKGINPGNWLHFFSSLILFTPRNGIRMGSDAI